MNLVIINLIADIRTSITVNPPTPQALRITAEVRQGDSLSPFVLSYSRKCYALRYTYFLISVTLTMRYFGKQKWTSNAFKRIHYNC